MFIEKRHLTSLESRPDDMFIENGLEQLFSPYNIKNTYNMPKYNINGIANNCQKY